MVNHRGMIRLCLACLSAIVTPAAYSAEPLFIETSATPGNPYVQAQVRYRVRLYRRSALDTGDFVTPHMPDVLVLAVAEDDPVEVSHDGDQYQMIERRYLLFPQRSGDLTLPAEVFSGREVFVRGAPTPLHVRPAADPRPPWLPATRLTLRERVKTPAAPLHVGGQIQRVFTLEAEGLTGGQLPALSLSGPDGLEHQRYRVEVDERVEGFSITGHRVEYHRYIAQHPGRYRLPGIQLRWWDTTTDTSRIASLPPMDIEVFPAKGKVPTPSRHAADTSIETSPAGGTTHAWTARSLVAALLLLALAAVAVRWLLPGFQRSLQRRRTLHRLRNACKHNDPHATARALREWTRRQWGRPLDPIEIAEHLDDPDLAPPLNALDRALYATRHPDWNGSALLDHLPSLLRRHHPSPPAKALPPLNP